MSGAVDSAGTRNPWLTVGGLARACSATARSCRCSCCSRSWSSCASWRGPGVFSADFAGTILRAAVPLAILAGCQTLTMLTGGIDLSVGAVASMAGFVVATLVGGQGLAVAILVALAIAALVGVLTGIGVGVFRVHPLIMTLGMGLVVLGLANVWQLAMVQTGAGVAPEMRTLGSDRARSGSCRTASSSSCRWRRSSCWPCDERDTAGCSTRSATTRSRLASPAHARGRSSSSCTSSRRSSPASPGS